MKSHPLFEKLRIFAPGPTPVPESVLAEFSKSPLHHRTHEFSKILEETKSGLKHLFQTKQSPYLLSASGSGAMEASVVNLLNPGEEALVIQGGKFGQRWEKICQKFGVNVHTLTVEWGKPANPEDVRELLTANPGIRAVLFQASETSTGVLHPVREIAEVVNKQGDALVIVDAITALGVTELPMDAWKLDVVVGGSQKALMLPPGLAFLAFSEKAHQRKASCKTPRFYFDLNAEDKAAQSGQTAWTPAVSLIGGLNIVLKKFQAAPLESVFRYYGRLAEATRTGIKAMGLSLLAPEAPSPAVTAAKVPEGVEGKKIVSHLRDRYGVTIAGGQDHLKGKIFRIGHLGFYDELDVLTVLSAVEMTLLHLGHPLEPGKGVGQAASFLVESQL